MSASCEDAALENLMRRSNLQIYEAKKGCNLSIHIKFQYPKSLGIQILPS